MSGNDLPTLDSCGSNNLELYAKAAISLDRNKAQKSTICHSMTVNDVLEMKGGFEALLFHFAQEFSTEIILCLMEISQFQQIVYEYYRENHHGTSDVLTQSYWLTTSRLVPRSSIVFGTVNNKRESNIAIGPLGI